MAVTILSIRTWAGREREHGKDIPARHETCDKPDCPDPAGLPPINQSETDGT